MKKLGIISVIFVLIGILLFIGIKLDIFQNTNDVLIIPNIEYYENLKQECIQEENMYKDCCLDSVKAMEVVGATLFPGGKYNCEEGFKRMTLRCPGSYTWCVASNDFIDEDILAPVPQEEPRINNGPGVDPDFPELVICTSDAKQCPDGSYVGRSEPNCEFDKCPGVKLPHLGNNYVEPIGIKLPGNIITEKECTSQGGEVWNTLGETSYNGELIGKIEGLLCPCACLIRPEKSDILWVNINGNIEEFKGDLDNIQTYFNCKNAGFAIKDGDPEICTVGESYMIDGKFKTFYNNPITENKSCNDYTYSSCPGNCIASCTSSSCSEPDKNGVVMCTSDCDGSNSCISK